VLYVYLIRSERFPDRKYVGLSSDFEQRLAEHNAGKSPHASEFRPWKLVAAFRFEDDAKARAFERCLKSGSGRAFAVKHLWQAAASRSSNYPGVE